MKKRMVSMLTVMALAVSMMSGCGSSGEKTTGGQSGENGSAKDGVELSIGFNVETSDATYERDIVPIFEEFKKMHPEVTNITLTGMGKMGEDQQVTRLTGGKYDDVLLLPMSMKTTDLPQYFAPLGDAKELGEKYFYGDYIQTGGQSYGLPIGVVYEGLIYNQEVLDECYGGKGPVTYDELMECCEAIKASGKNCFYTNAGAQWPLRFWDNLAITISEDPAYANTIVDNKTPWAEGEPLYQSCKLLGDLAAGGYIEGDVVTEQWDNSRVSVATGDTAFMLIGTWALPQIKEVAQEMGKDPETIKFAPFPYKNNVSADNKLQVRVSEDLFLGVNKNSPNLELAKEFCVFFCENVSLSRGMNESMKEGGRQVEDLKSLQDLDYVEYYSSPAKDTKIADMAGAAKIDVFSVGTYLQEYIIQPSIDGKGAQFEELNKLWAQNFQ